jgi:CAAX protease family protein
VLLLPPLLVAGVLLSLTIVVSRSYMPNLFLAGILFGIPAGYLEEIGWTGYVFPKMDRSNALTSSIFLGLLWSAWHLPAIDYLGTATPHGAYWFRFFLVFTAAMTAMRVLISWIYVRTRSLLLAQLMHVSSTGALVIFSAPNLTAGQEVMWYGVYACVLWAAVAIVVHFFWQGLARPREAITERSDSLTRRPAKQLEVWRAASWTGGRIRASRRSSTMERHGFYRKI